MSSRLATAERVLGSPIRNLVSILLFMGAVIVIGTIAYMIAGWSFADATYMVALTIYTVGYGEVRPIDTAYLHAVTMCLMVFGCTGMILLTSALVQLFTVLQLREMLGANRMQSRIDELTAHAIICGYGRIGVMLAQDLSAAGMPLIVLERDPAKAAQAEAAGHAVLTGDAADETALFAAGVERARVLASVLPNDAANVFITLSARNLNAKLEIIARGEVPSTERKLLHAGADHVVLPTHIGAERIANMILFPARERLLDDTKLAAIADDLEDLGLAFEQVTVIERSTGCGMTIDQVERQAAGAFFIVRIDRGQAGSLVQPARNEKLDAGDRVAFVARDSAVAHSLLAVTSRIRAGRNTY